ncbi:MAG: Gldg family protein [Bacillus sp. (in: Bacteria)]|nr:Gldg family protein [Bacillus sp. (in: firmicutes)]MCM1427031.1 Gldg family protein [Eubacterium sp.]
MIAIYKREVKSFLHSFIGWLFFAAMLLLMGIYFTFYNILNGYPNLSYVLQGVVVLFLFAIPILTMRSLSEERKLKTDQLILTAPVSVVKIVLGKYLALLTVFAVPVVILGLAPVILSFFGEFEIGVSYTALFGFFLYGAAGLAIGLFLSSLTESIVIAAVLTFIALFLGYQMTAVCSMISQTGNFLTAILGAFDMADKFMMMLIGSFYVPSVIYFLSVTFFFLFCTAQSIQKRRYSIVGEDLKTGIYHIGVIMVTVALTAVVNVLAHYLPENIRSFDVTSNKIYTLTEQTKEFVAKLSDDITVYVLTDETYKDDNLDTTLKKMADLSEHITVTYVNPIANPLFYSNYTDTEPSDNSLIIVGPARSKVLDYNDIYVVEYYSYTEYQITGYDGEGQIAAALSYVTANKMPKIYVVTGHEEWELERQFMQAVEKENIAYETLSLLKADAVPDDAQAIVLSAPLRDYSADETEKVIAYLEKGGNAIIIPAWTDEELPNFNRILDYYGISLMDGIVLEGDADKYYGDIPYFLFPQIDYDEMTDSVYGMNVFVPYAKAILYEEQADVVYTPLLETSEDSYCKSYQQDGMQIMTDFSKADGDVDGPFVIALRADKTLTDAPASQAVVVSSEQFFTEEADRIVPGNHVKLFAGMVGTLVEHENAVMLPVKYYSTALVFSTRTAAIVNLVLIFIVPTVCLITGFAIWWRRRRL